MASSTGNIKQAYDVNGEKIYPKVILDAIEGEGGKTGMEIIKEAVGGIGMENLKGVSVEYDDIDGNHHLVFKSHYEESAGGYIKETIVGEGPLVIGNFSETNPYADDHIYVSKNLSILGDANTLEFAADASAVTSRNISGKIAHANNSIQIINNDAQGKLELFGGGEGAEDCVSISASLMNIPKDVSISKKLNVSGSTEVATTSGATLSVGGDATFSNTITVNGKSRFKNDVSLDGQTAFRGSSPKLSFTSYENKTNSTNRATGYIVEHYGTSNNTSLEMYDGTENNAHLSLSGSDKTFTVKVNSNNALILDGSNKVAKIQPYSSDENSPSLVIDGSKKTTTLKSDNNTKLVLDDSNAVLYGDSNRYMELNGSNGEINLNASADKKTYLKLDGTNREINLNASADKKTYLKLDGTNGEIDLHADVNRFLSMPKERTEVSLCSFGQKNTFTYLKLDGDVSSHPYTKLSALRDMYLGMNDTSGNLRLQAKGGTYLMFDVSGNNNSVGLRADASSYLQIDAISKNAKLQTDDNYYLQIDASKGESKLYAGSVTGLYLDNNLDQRDVNLFADNSTYLKLWAGDHEQEVRLYANDNYYLKIDAFNEEAKMYAGSVGLYLDNSSEAHDVNLHADNSTYLKLLGGEKEKKVHLYANDHTRLSMDGDASYSYARLYADNQTYIQANAYEEEDDEENINEVKEIVLKSGITGLYLIGGYDPVVRLSYNTNNRIEINGSVVSSTIPMTAKVNNVSDVRLGCPIGTIVMWGGTETNKAPENWVFCDGKSYNRYGTYKKLYDVIGTTFGSSSTSTFNVPDFRQKFPLGAKTGTMDNGYNSSGTKLTVDTSLGKTGGDSSVMLSAQTMPSHAHDAVFGSYNGSGSGYYAGRTGGSSNWPASVATDEPAADDGRWYGQDSNNKPNTYGFIQKRGGGSAHSNMPPYLAINFIIKYN